MHWGRHCQNAVITLFHLSHFLLFPQEDSIFLHAYRDLSNFIVMKQWIHLLCFWIFFSNLFILHLLVSFPYEKYVYWELWIVGLFWFLSSNAGFSLKIKLNVKWRVRSVHSLSIIINTNCHLWFNSCFLKGKKNKSRKHWPKGNSRYSLEVLNWILIILLCVWKPWQQ